MNSFTLKIKEASDGAYVSDPDTGGAFPDLRQRWAFQHLFPSGWVDCLDALVYLARLHGWEVFVTFEGGRTAFFA